LEAAKKTLEVTQPSNPPWFTIFSDTLLPLIAISNTTERQFFAKSSKSNRLLFTTAQNLKIVFSHEDITFDP